MTRGKRSARGFTLVEVIIALTILAVMGTLYYTYIQQTRQSPLASARFTKSMALQKVMMNIYTNKKLHHPTNLVPLSSTIGTEGTWQNNDYGVYQVAVNRFVKFVSDVETDALPADGKDILKVTIRNDQGESVSLLLRSN